MSVSYSPMGRPQKTRASSEAKQDHCQGVNAVGAVVLKTVFVVQPLGEKAQLTFLTQFLKK